MTPIRPRETQRVRAFGLRLQRLPGNLGHHPGLLFSLTLQGYRDHTFGGRAGPSVHLSHLFHELAHAAQFGPKQFARRAKPHGFVFKMPTVCVQGRHYDEPDTRQGVERELDTFAHQLHLMQAAGLKMAPKAFIAYSATLMRFMPDWYNVPGKGEEQRFAFCRAYIEQRYAALSQDAVLENLRGWLDATHRRLRRQLEKDRPFHRVKRRYRSDGSFLTDETDQAARAA